MHQIVLKLFYFQLIDEKTKNFTLIESSVG